jgi:serine protease Do
VLLRTPRIRQPFVLTNRHVVAEAALSAIKLKLSDGRIVNPREKLEDPESDLAVLKVDDPGLPTAEFGDSDNLDIGHFVMAMGSPFGLSQSVTLGIISAKGRRSLDLPGNRRVINQDFLQTDAAINPGNSGGPLIDLQGRVVGLNTAIASQGGGNEGIGFSIPSNLAQYIAEQLLEQGRVRRGYLGVLLDDKFDDAAARQYGLPRLMGARVLQVYDGTPAARAGLKVDDIVLNFDGAAVQDETDLIHRVSLTPINKTIRIVVLRGGQQLPLQITLTERALGPQSAAPESPPGPGEVPFRNSSLQVLTLEQGLAVQAGFAPGERGLLVTALPPEPTELRLYDVIVEVARTPVTSVLELEELLEQFAPGPILLKVRRAGPEGIEERLVRWSLPLN